MMRLLTLFAVAIASVGLSVTTNPTTVRAATCDTSWTGTAGDSNWFTPGNWSAGTPTTTTAACLPTGSSAVHIAGASAVAGSLSIAAGAALSLDIVGCGPASAFLTLNGDSSNAGVIDLTNMGDACGGTAQLIITSPHTLTSTGAINTTGCCRGDRQLTGNVINQGNVNVNFEAACCGGNTGLLHLDGPGSLFDNQGAVNIANGMQAVVSGGGGEEFRNSGGGSVNAGPGCQICETPGQLIVMAGGTFTEGAGTTTGDHVLLYGGATLHFTGSGSSSFDLRGYQGSNILSGPTIAAGQTVELQLTGCGPGPFSSIATLANSMTNAGTINLRNLDNACGGTDQIVIPPGDTLTNTGTINTTGCCRGDRQLTGNVINQGTVNVNFEAACCVGTNGVLHLDGPASLFDNQGAFNIANGMQAVVSGGSGEEFRNSAGGSITAGPGCPSPCELPGQLVVNSGSTFTQGAGITSGDDVLVDGGANLHFTGSGSSSFDLRGDQGGNTISGSAIASVQTVHMECGSVTTLAGSMTSAGTVDFHNNACGSNVQLVIPGGSTLTNTGTIEATGCCGGARELTGSVTNRGTLTFLQGANFGGSTPFTIDGGGTFDNFGTIAVNTGDQALNNVNDTLILEPGGSFTLHTDDTLGSFGTYIQGSSATLAVTVDANTSTNTSIVGGNTVVSGGLQVTTLGIPAAGTTWPIINGHLRIGSFATTSFGSVPYTFQPPYPASSSGVTLVAPFLDSTASTPSTSNTAVTPVPPAGVAPGTTVYDRATVAGNSTTLSPSPNNEGSVAFYICSPATLAAHSSTTCSSSLGTLFDTETLVGSSGAGAPVSVFSTAQNPNGAGRWCFAAYYSGDAHFPASFDASSSECFNVTVLDSPPTADSGGPYSGVEGAPISITGKAGDPDGQTVTSNWSVASNAGNDPGAACVIADPAALNTSVTCNDEGGYTLTLSATDSGGLTTTATTTLTVSNAPPSVGAITGLPAAPIAIGTSVQASVTFADPGTLDSHTASWNWGDGSVSAGAISESGGSGTVTGTHTFAAAGIYTVVVTVTDADGASGSSQFQFVVVFDPSAGFATGGGWITSPAGAYVSNPSAAGKASFGFVSRYQKGANVPTGNTDFRFQAGSLNFRSTAYQWLVIAGACKAQFKGTGTINGSGDYTFLLTAVDGDRCATPGPDTFRIQITDNATGATVYDNGAGQATGGGDIQVHS
jgi:hypothetical protein